MTATLIIVGLVLLNGLFVAAEFAIISASKPALEQALLQGTRGALRVLDVLKDRRHQDRYIATAQLGITFASLGLGMYGEHVFATWLEGPLSRLGLDSVVTVHGTASALAVAFLTFVHIVLGEMVPKTLALQHPLSTAIAVNPVMRIVNGALFPLIVVMNALGTAILRLFGVRRSLEGHAPTREHLQFIVAESVAEGQIDAEAGEVLAELFDFSERTATEVMTPRVRVVGLPRRAPASMLRQVLRERRHTRYPVYDETLDQIAGFVLIRDLLDPLLSDTSLPDALIRPIPFVPETSRLDHVLALMRREKTQMVVVMDEFGGTAGIVSVEDLFEEVVGEIADGQSANLPVDWVNGKLIAQGFARIDELGEALDRPTLEHPEVDTVSGLVLFLLDRPPEIDDRVDWEGLELRVRSVEGHGVKEAEVNKIDEPSP